MVQEINKNQQEPEIDYFGFDAFNAIERVKSIFPELIGLYSVLSFKEAEKQNFELSKKYDERGIALAKELQKIKFSDDFMRINLICDKYAAEFRDLLKNID